MSAELPFGARQIVRGLCYKQGGCEMSAGWLAKRLVKAKCFVGNENGQRGVVPRKWREGGAGLCRFCDVQTI